MRRTSLVAPILLIALGALLLARTLYPGLQVMDYLARYWPVILIGWGMLRIVEISLGRRRRNLCRRGDYRAASGS